MRGGPLRLIDVGLVGPGSLDFMTRGLVNSPFRLADAESEGFVVEPLPNFSRVLASGRSIFFASSIPLLSSIEKPTSCVWAMGIEEDIYLDEADVRRPAGRENIFMCVWLTVMR